MSEPIRFHLDEHVDPDIARALRQPGIAYCHKSARSLGEIIRSLILIYEVLTPEEITGRVQYL